VTQYCLIATCEQRRLFHGERRRDGLANQVHAAVNLVKTGIPKTNLDLLCGDACVEKLPPRHHTVLLGGKVRNQAVRPSSERFGVYMTPNPTLDPGAP
jgi:hypothetical protein